MKTLVLAEKPSVGRDIARVLNCKKTTKTFMEGDKYIVTWAMGHLVELADPSAYDNHWKEWSLETLPMLPERMKHKVIGRTGRQFNSIKQLIHRKDVTDIVIATDAGREGELVARWILRLSGCKKNIKRLWINSQTNQAIQDGFKTLKPGKDFERLFRAAECRAEADWLVGLNITRALTCRYDSKFSAGRVQTPTLSLILKREETIRNFQTKPFWVPVARFKSFTALWKPEERDNRFYNRQEAENFLSPLSGLKGEVASLKVKERREPPPLAYDLTALQREANGRYGYSAKKTLNTMQSLYERHKIVTYPRTDSRYIPKDVVATLGKRLDALKNTSYGDKAAEIKTVLESGKHKPGKRFVDDSKISDHHAIIPTELAVNITKLNSEEQHIWELIVHRFLSALMADARYKESTVTIKLGNELFKNTKSVLSEPGWKALDGVSASSGTMELHEYLNEGDEVAPEGIELDEGRTSPPERYTEGTLLAAMENPSDFVNDKEMKATLREGGLGTPATRADIIEKLFDNWYIERNGKEIIPTSRGYELYSLVPDMFKSPELTAKWEKRLENIARGEEKAGAFLTDIRKITLELVTSVKKSGLKFVPKNLSNKDCPMCGKKMIAMKDKKGNAYFGCQSFSCGYEEEPERGNDLYRKPTQREKRQTRHLVKKYEAKGNDTVTLGDMLKAAMEKKKK